MQAALNQSLEYQQTDPDQLNNSLMQVNQVTPLTPALLFLPPPMTIPETGTESTEPTLLTRAKVVDKVDAWKLDLPLHEYQIPQHSDLQEGGRRDQVSNRDMTTQ